MQPTEYTTYKSDSFEKTDFIITLNPKTTHFSKITLLSTMAGDRGVQPEIVDARCSYRQGMGKMGTDGDALLQDADLAKVSETAVAVYDCQCPLGFPRAGHVSRGGASKHIRLFLS